MKLPGGEGSGSRRDWEFGVSRFKVLYIGGTSNTMPPHSTGPYIQYHTTNHSGKNCGKNVHTNRWIAALQWRNRHAAAEQLRFENREF